jgi:soluble lytic murein transglycosylase-like protein
LVSFSPIGGIGSFWVRLKPDTTYLWPLVAAVIALIGLASPAEAQIYSWRDPDGRLVLSNTRPHNADSVQSYAVPDAEGVRTTRNTTAVDRAATYEDMIVEHSRLNGVRPSLVRAVVQVESGFNPRAYSPKGAMGLMQLMPATAREFGVRNPFNPEDNVRGGVAYLKQLLDRYDNNEQLALAAYNAGPAAVDKHGQSIPPYRETRDYVSKVNGIAGDGADRPVTGRTKLYRTIDIVDGHEVIKYTDRKPQ